MARPIDEMTGHRPTVALTGATGFVGRRLVSELLANGWHVRALARTPTHELSGDHLTIIPGAIEDEASLRVLIEESDAVIHCAGAIKGWRARDFMAVNSAGTERLARLCLEAPQPLRFIFISTLAASQPHLSPYAASKRSGEDALISLGSELAWWVVRPPVVYGPGDRETFRLFQAISAGFAPVPSDRARFSLIHVDDLTTAIRQCLTADLLPNQVLEISDDRPGGYSWHELADVAAELLDIRIRRYRVPRLLMVLFGAINLGLSLAFKIPPMITPAKVRELYHPDWVCKTNPIAELTPWRPEFDLKTGLDDTLSWYKREGWL